MSNVTIFKQQTTVVPTGKRGVSELARSLASSVTMRRIQANVNGTFKRIVNGEQIGNAMRGQINLIIVDALPKVSRTFYAGKYDPDNPTSPNCWSNLGDKPEDAAEDKQHTNCADCPQNVKGSGTNGGKACRYQRRIAVLVEGDTSGEVYQFNVPAKSLFGKGTGNVHPFESYIKFLVANGESPDNVVTQVSFDDNADTMELTFTPLRNVSDEEYELVKAAQANPESKMYTRITVAQASGVTKKPAPADKVQAPTPEAKVVRSDEPDDDVPPPTKRTAKPEAPAAQNQKALADLLNEWGKDE
jgi:hypothetical protein